MNDPLIPKEELSELSEKSTEKNNLVVLLAVLIGLIIVLITHNFYSIIEMWTDKSLPLVMCPREFNQDRPVLMKKISDASPQMLDNWIRSFAINYVINRYPRTIDDVEDAYQYVKTRSQGIIQEDFDSRLSEIEDIKKKFFDSYIKFYFKNSKSHIKIRKVDGRENEWVVSIDGYMHKKSSFKIEKTQPTIYMTIIADKPTIYNPEGLYVINYEIKYVVDPIAGNVISL